MAKAPNNTYRTLLLEKFTEDGPDLATILATRKTGVDDVAKDIEEKLEVHTFQEFLTRFAPKIYEEVENGHIVYRTDNRLDQTKNIRAISITEHMYYKMLTRLYESKGKSGEANISFDTNEYKEMLRPEQELTEIKNTRKLLAVNRDNAIEAEKKGKDAQPYYDEITRLRKLARAKYKSSAVNLLPAAIDMTEKKIGYLEQKKETLREHPEQLEAQDSVMQLTFGENGNIEMLPVPIATQEREKEATAKLSISGLLEKDYTRSAEKAGVPATTFMKDLVVTAFSPDARFDGNDLGADFPNLPVEAKEQRINDTLDVYNQKLTTYKDRYKEAKDTFIRSMNEIIEKLLGVRTLFDLATKDGGEKGCLADGLIVANCKVKELLEQKANLSAYLEKISEDTEEKIWYAALPAVDEMAVREEDEDDDDDIGGEDDYGRPQAKRTVAPTATFPPDTMQDLAQIVDIMSAGYITTVFSFRGSKDNGFSALDAQWIEQKRKKLLAKIAADAQDHAVFVFPDFTLLDENETVALFDAYEKTADADYVDIDENGNPVKNMEDGKITIPGVFIEAAYAAVGLLIRAQQTDCLRKAELPVDDAMPCVRVNLADPDISQALTTHFTRENLLRWSQSVHDAIADAPFAFVFCGDPLERHGKELRNTYVYQANTLSGRPMSDVMFEDYIRCRCKKWGKVQQTVEEELETLKKTWRRASKGTNIVNKMLKDGEDVQMVPAPNGKDKAIEITIRKRPSLVRNLKITTKEAE